MVNALHISNRNEALIPFVPARGSCTRRAAAHTGQDNCQLAQEQTKLIISHFKIGRSSTCPQRGYSG